MILIGDSLQQLATMPDASVHCCVTSPPYFGLRDYGMDGQIGLEATPDAFVARLVEVFREVRRVLRDDGTLWLNLGDSYSSSPPGNKTTGVSAKSGLNGINGASGKYRETLDAGHATKRDTSRLPGLKPKDLIGIPWRVAFALQADGWYLRQDVIWSKPNPMPESVTDRCTKAHEYIFMLSKSARYFYDAETVKEPAVSTDARKFTDGGRDKQSDHGRRYAGFNGRYADKIALEGAPATRNRRSVWTVATKPFKEAHFATFPPDLIEPCILAGCPVGGTVLDPFFGAGTTGLVAQNNGRKWIGIELNPKYAAIAKRRLGLASDPLHLWMTAA
jgi:DNA modification methylase